MVQPHRTMGVKMPGCLRRKSGKLRKALKKEVCRLCDGSALPLLLHGCWPACAPCAQGLTAPAAVPRIMCATAAVWVINYKHFLSWKTVPGSSWVPDLSTLEFSVSKATFYFKVRAVHWWGPAQLWWAGSIIMSSEAGERGGVV